MCCFPSSKGAAQSTGDWYKGRTIQPIIGAGAGGGIDLYGRLVARHRETPSWSAQRRSTEYASGGRIAAANYLYNVAPKDGTVIGIMSQDYSQRGPWAARPSIRGWKVQLGRAHQFGRAGGIHVACQQGQDYCGRDGFLKRPSAARVLAPPRPKVRSCSIKWWAQNSR
jgi:hypothetical protein